MAIIKKTFKESGIVVGKEIKEASEEIKFMENGKEKVIPAQPMRYIVKIVSSEDVDEKNGMATPSYVEFTLNSGSPFVNNVNAKIASNEDVELFNKLKYLDKILVKLEMTTSGSFKMVGVVKESK